VSEIVWLVVGVLGFVCVMLGAGMTARIDTEDPLGVIALGLIAAIGMTFAGFLTIVISLANLL
jgi:hypothetical protein